MAAEVQDFGFAVGFAHIVGRSAAAVPGSESVVGIVEADVAAEERDSGPGMGLAHP